MSQFLLIFLFLYFFFRNEKVRILKSDWTKFVCSCPAENADALNTLPRNLAGEVDTDRLPPSVKLHWKVRPKPSYAAEVRSGYVFFSCIVLVHTITIFILRGWKSFKISLDFVTEFELMD